MEPRTQQEITQAGNPRCPQGADGAAMLRRMNESHRDVTAWALSHWHVSPKDRILDVGCGGGGALARLAPLVPEGHLTGVDYSPVSVATARETNAPAIAAGQMDILEASVERLPFTDGSFDKVLTVESFYFWPAPQENLREVLRVLAPGGRFLLVADVYQCPQLDETAQENIRRYDLFNPTPEEFFALLDRAGFRDIRVNRKAGTTWICVEGSKLA